VQLGPGIAETPGQLRFDIHMHVFQLRIKNKPTGVNVLPNCSQARFEALELLVGQNSRTSQGARVCDTPANILAVKPPVKGDRLAASLEQAGGRLPEASLPHDA
jgi:hypothetical protein